jgi:hypothetical protein
MATNETAHNQVLGSCDRCGDDFYRPVETLAAAKARGESVSLCAECETARCCTACGSEIVEAVNDGAFRDGERGGCEYERDRSHAQVLDAARALYGLIDELREDGCDLFDDHGPLLEHCQTVLAEQAKTFPENTAHEQAN